MAPASPPTGSVPEQDRSKEKVAAAQQCWLPVRHGSGSRRQREDIRYPQQEEEEEEMWLVQCSTTGYARWPPPFPFPLHRLAFAFFLQSGKAPSKGGRARRRSRALPHQLSLFLPCLSFFGFGPS
jgi:hypothetical protein